MEDNRQVVDDPRQGESLAYLAKWVHSGLIVGQNKKEITGFFEVKKVKAPNLALLNPASSSPEIIEYKVYRVKVPDGYAPVREDGRPKVLGEGLHGVVFLVEDSEGREWALKYFKQTHPFSPDTFAEHQEYLTDKASTASSEVAEEVVLAKQWQSFNNPIETKPIAGRPEVVIKTYVTGQSLKHLIEKGEFFNDEASGVRMRQRIRDLLVDISDQKLAFDDLNAGNLIYSEGRWVVVDSKIGEAVGSPENALKTNITKFRKKIVPFDTYAATIGIHKAKAMFGHGVNLPAYNFKNFNDVKRFADGLDDFYFGVTKTRIR